MYFQIVEEAAEGKREIHSHDMKAHIQWLSDAHKRELAEMPVGDILERLPGPEEFNIWF